MNQEACVAKLSQISPDYHNSAITKLADQNTPSNTKDFALMKLVGFVSQPIFYPRYPFFITMYIVETKTLLP